jgi:hypothetical protein
LLIGSKKFVSDFVNIDPGDQFTIVRLAGLMGVMLATAIHQYIPEEHNFTNFYNFHFQPDHPHYEFRFALLDYGKDIQELNCDFVEAAMMNACMAAALGRRAILFDTEFISPLLALS